MTTTLDDFDTADAAVCGALGCHRDDTLRVVHTGNRRSRRVVCPEHAADLMEATT